MTKLLFTPKKIFKPKCNSSNQNEAFQILECEDLENKK